MRVTQGALSVRWAGVALPLERRIREKPVTSAVELRILGVDILNSAA